MLLLMILEREEKKKKKKKSQAPCHHEAVITRPPPTLPSHPPETILVCAQCRPHTRGKDRQARRADGLIAATGHKSPSHIRKQRSPSGGGLRWGVGGVLSFTLPYNVMSAPKPGTKRCVSNLQGGWVDRWFCQWMGLLGRPWWGGPGPQSRLNE